MVRSAAKNFGKFTILPGQNLDAHSRKAAAAPQIQPQLCIN